MANWDFEDVERWEFSRRRFLKILAFTGTVSSIELFGPFKNMGFGKEKPIKIGVCNALSGSLTTLGTWGVWGSTLAVNRWNQSGGHNGRPIELIVDDNEAKVPTAIRKP